MIINLCPHNAPDLIKTSIKKEFNMQVLEIEKHYNEYLLDCLCESQVKELKSNIRKRLQSSDFSMGQEILVIPLLSLTSEQVREINDTLGICSVGYDYIGRTNQDYRIWRSTNAFIVNREQLNKITKLIHDVKD